MLLIALLTYSAVRTWGDTMIVLLNIPVACTGGVAALLLTHVNFSVSAAMGFISIFGNCGPGRHSRGDVLPAPAAARGAPRRAGSGRCREEATSSPCLAGDARRDDRSLPAALSDGIGSQTQKPLAIVVIGGAIMLAIVARIVQPPLLVAVHTWLASRDEGRSGDPRLAD